MHIGPMPLPPSFRGAVGRQICLGCPAHFPILIASSYKTMWIALLMAGWFFQTGTAFAPGHEILGLVNEARKSGCRCGKERMPPVEPLQWDAQLARSAALHAQDMYAQGYFSHTSKDGRRIGDRATAAGFRWRAIGENLGYGYATAEQVVKGWKGSPGHCKNLMSPKFTRMGAASQGSYWVQVLGRPSPGG